MHKNIVCHIQDSDINSFSISHVNTEILTGPGVSYKYLIVRFEPSEYAVFPSLSFAFRLAPTETRYSTTSGLSLSDAIMSGVFPSLVFASLLAPTEIRYWTTSRWPFDDAQMSGVHP